MPVVQDYLDYTRKWKREYGEKTLVLMQVGSFFEVYGLREEDGTITGSNITDFSRECDMLIANKSQKIEGKSVVMAGFNVSQLEKYIRKLQKHGYTVPIYTQDKQSKNTTRSLEEIVSPGTYFSSEETRILSNNLMCVWLSLSRKTRYSPSLIHIGVAVIDNFTGKSFIQQFSKEYYKDASPYDDLERCVSIYSPQECLLLGSNMNEASLKELIPFVGLSNVKTHLILDSDVKSKTQMSKNAHNAGKQIYQKEVLCKFFPELSAEFCTNFIHRYDYAIQAFVYLLDFIYQHNPNLNNKISFPDSVNNTHSLLLANHSLCQLNIIDDDRFKGKLSSLTSFLNNCVTSMGKRRFIYNLTSPTFNEKVLKNSYDLTSVLIKSNLWKDVRETLYNVGDLEKFSRRLVYKRVGAKSIVKLYRDLLCIGKVFKLLSEPSSSLPRIVQESIKEGGMLCGNEVKCVIEKIKNTFHLEKSEKIDDLSKERLGMLTPTEACFLLPKASSKVDTLLKKSEESSLVYEKLRSYLSEKIKKAEKGKRVSLSYVKVHETPKGDPVLMATNRRANILKEELKGSQKCTVHVNGVDYNLNDVEFTSLGSNRKDKVITSPLLRKIARNIQTSRDELIGALSIFFTEFISKELIEKQDELERISRFCAWADNLQNKCYMAVNYNYTRPTLDTSREKSFFALEKLRHPLIEHLNVDELYVTNDLILGNIKDGMLLYGTNAVGKTSLIRAVGISIVMAQAGLYVPCSKMVFKPYKKIFTRILGNDNLFKGLSTFAVEMSELRTILTLSDENSIVIGDELCSGTESDSARSIFTAGVECLHEKKSTFLFATHFHEINDYEEITALDRLKIMHMTVTYNKKEDKLIYDRKLKEGAGENMYGLEVCKSLHLPDTFLSRAHAIRVKYDPKSQNTLSLKKTRYNMKKLKNGMCELCGKRKSSEVHHLQHQASATPDGIINSSFHKNHPANLISVCDLCHKLLHEQGKEHRRVKTTSGPELVCV